MKTRSRWEALEQLGLCPECEQTTCHETCRKRAFDGAYNMGFHDGANGLWRHEDAFVTWLIERGELDDDEDAA